MSASPNQSENIMVTQLNLECEDLCQQLKRREDQNQEILKEVERLENENYGLINENINLKENIKRKDG